MLNVKRNENAIDVEITIQVPSVGPRVFTFSSNFGSEIYAGFFQYAARTLFFNYLKADRQYWYELGYKQGRAKVGKTTWFPGDWRWPG